MIEYLKGDATDPQIDGIKYIVHVCNDLGGWGRGFVLAVSKRWKEPEIEYRTAHAAGELTLGDVQYVHVANDIVVVNMVAQAGYGYRNRNLHQSAEPNCSIPLQYDILASCLSRVGVIALGSSASIHMPRIGCGLAGGTWDKVEPLIDAYLGGSPVYVYDI